jgi:hypothetical protein
VASYQNIFTNAYLFAKLDIGILEEVSGKSKVLVGYLATMHLPAYESETTALSRDSRPLSTLHTEFNNFQKKTIQENEEIAFAILAGDFNLCNVSKCKCFYYANYFTQFSHHVSRQSYRINLMKCFY